MWIITARSPLKIWKLYVFVISQAHQLALVINSNNLEPMGYNPDTSDITRIFFYFSKNITINTHNLTFVRKLTSVVENLGFDFEDSFLAVYAFEFLKNNKTVHSSMVIKV